MDFNSFINFHYALSEDTRGDKEERTACVFASVHVIACACDVQDYGELLLLGILG